MKKFIVIFALLATQVSAQPVTPEQVASECIRQMQIGVCRTRQDKSTINPGQAILISGVGRVSYSAYFDYMDLYNEKYPNDPAMCKLALRYMKSQPGGDHDKIARAFWTPQFHSTSLEDESVLQVSSFKNKILAAMALFIQKF